MDHYAPTHDFAHQWRTRTMIVSAVAGVELVALIAVGVLVLGKGWFQQARASAAASHATARTHRATTKTHASKPAGEHAKTPAAPARKMLSRSQTSVLVLNGNGRNGAAGDEATVLRQHGYPVRAVGNASRSDYAASIVMYRPGLQREAQRLAHDVGIPIVSALDGLQPSQLHGAKLGLIVGN